MLSLTTNFSLEHAIYETGSITGFRGWTSRRKGTSVLRGQELRQAVAMVARKAFTEASGRVTPATAPDIAATGVDLFSVGWLTHSAPLPALVEMKAAILRQLILSEAG